MLCLYKYLDLASKFLIKMHARKEPPPAINRAPRYRFIFTPLRIQDDNIAENTTARSPIIFRKLQYVVAYMQNQKAQRNVEHHCV